MIPFKLTYKYGEDQTNPYHIRDGKWGGMGGYQQWFIGLIHLKIVDDENVYETSRKYITFDKDGKYHLTFWHRFWNFKEEIWQPMECLSPEKLSRLPVFNLEYIRNVDFNKIYFPKFAKDLESLITAHEFVSVQPMVSSI